MQKRSVSSSSGAQSGSAVDAMTALTAAVQELQAAMSVLAGSLAGGIPTPPHLASPTEGRGTGAPDRSTMSAVSHGSFGISPETHSYEQIGPADDLITDDELKLTGHTERLATDEAKAMSDRVKGIEDYLPALTANRPAAFLRADSAELAEIWRGNEGNEGSWGNWGNAGSGVASGELDGNATERLAEAIGRLADAILHGAGRSGSALHPGEAQGGLNGLLQSGRVGARPDGYN